MGYVIFGYADGKLRYEPSKSKLDGVEIRSDWGDASLDIDLKTQMAKLMLPKIIYTNPKRAVWEFISASNTETFSFSEKKPILSALGPSMQMYIEILDPTNRVFVVGFK